MSMQYNYAVVKKTRQQVNSKDLPVNGPHEYFILEPSQTKATELKSYNYAVVYT